MEWFDSWADKVLAIRQIFLLAPVTWLHGPKRCSNFYQWACRAIRSHVYSSDRKNKNGWRSDHAIMDLQRNRLWNKRCFIPVWRLHQEQIWQGHVSEALNLHESVRYLVVWAAHRVLVKCLLEVTRARHTAHTYLQYTRQCHWDILPRVREWRLQLCRWPNHLLCWAGCTRNRSGPPSQSNGLQCGHMLGSYRGAQLCVWSEVSALVLKFKGWSQLRQDHYLFKSRWRPSLC